MRLFAALDLPVEIKEELRRCQQHAKFKTTSTIRWVERERMHLTLVFLGETRADLVPALRRVLDDAAAETEPFAIHVRGIGAFGPPSRPRTIWAGVSEQDRVQMLQYRLGDALDALGFVLRERSAVPHVTLGRVVQSAGDLAAMLDPLEPVFGGFRVEKISLLRSTLSSSGTEYTTLHESWLEG